MLGVLREELQMHSAGGAEERMIRASLRGLKGSAQEQANVKALLNLFALVPEDTTGRCSHTTHILIYIYIYIYPKDISGCLLCCVHISSIGIAASYI